MPTIRTAAGKGAELTPTEADTDMKRPVTAVTSTPVTLTEAHNRNIIECGTGSGTLALTAAATLAAIDTEDWFVDIVNTTSSAITIDPNGSETIDGANTYTIAPEGSIRVFLNAAKTGFRTSGTNASTYIKTLLDDTDAITARETLGFFYTMTGGVQTLAYTFSGQYISPNTGAILSAADGHGFIVPYTGHIVLGRMHVRTNTLDAATLFRLMVNGVVVTTIGYFPVATPGAANSDSISAPVTAGDRITIQFYHTSAPTTGGMSNCDFTLVLTA